MYNSLCIRVSSLEQNLLDSFTLRKVEFDAIRRIVSQFCRCSLGKGLARRMGPSRNPTIIHRWLKQTTQMVAAIRDVSLPPLGGVVDITEHLARAHVGGGATGEDYLIIASTLDGASNVHNYLCALGEELDELHQLAGGIGVFDGEVRAIRAMLEPSGRIRDDASVRLAGIRREIAQTTQHIGDVIHSYLRDPAVSKLLQNVAVTLHGDRYVLPVKVENRGRLPGVVHRASNTGATVFVEPSASVELNNRLSDLSEDERREVQRLLNQLAIRISPRAGEMVSTLKALAGIDLLSAKAQYAYQFEMTCPTVAERGQLEFNEARHPLLLEQARRRERIDHKDKHRDEVVPIDVRLGEDFDLLVITGPNTGGKTVTLKTVALLVLMAQSGMHIPAQRGSKMPVFRDVFIDIGDEQSLQQSLSTFGAHIKRINYILRKASKASLVLLDELGAGTDPEEGGAIGQSILDELRRIGCFGVVTTHLSMLKAYAVNHERVDNASVEFSVKTLSPTYRLQIGTPGESHAITVAQRLGMPKRMTTAARKHVKDQTRQFRRAIRATGEARQVAEAARVEAREAQQAAEVRQEAYESRLAELHRVKEDFEAWLASLSQLRTGDEVFVPSLGKTARLVRMELHKQIALVDCGAVQVEVPLSQLMPDLGQSAVGEQIASLREEILDQARQAQADRAEAKHAQAQYKESLQLQQTRARQFDTWLGAIARLRVGQEVPITHKPGTGKVLSVNMPALVAKVEVAGGKQLELSIQDLFPQTGPFCPEVRQERQAAKTREKQRKKAAASGNKPMQRRSSSAKAAQANREELLAMEPGAKVFVVPFGKRATLIRVSAEKELATVQSGIFEMEIPICDLEPADGNQRGK